MAGPLTYTALKSSIATRMVRTDLDGLMGEFISDAEARFNRELRVPEMEEVSQATTIGGTITLPDDLLQIRSVYLAGQSEALRQVDLPVLRRMQASTGAPQPPVIYALQSGNEIAFAPAPTDDYPIVLNYWRRVPALSDAEPTNWLLEQHYDLYRAAALVEAYAHARDKDALLLWEQRTQGMIGALNEAGKRKAIAKEQPPMRVAGDLLCIGRHGYDINRC